MSAYRKAVPFSLYPGTYQWSDQTLLNCLYKTSTVLKPQLASVREGEGRLKSF